MLFGIGLIIFFDDIIQLYIAFVGMLNCGLVLHILGEIVFCVLKYLQNLAGLASYFHWHSKAFLVAR